MSLKPTIGMETHVELDTESKMFCSCKVVETDEPNISLCPTCLGLPGALPVPNKKAIEYIVMLSLGANCSITKEGMFHRKNYFYPDLPKNYQISQFDFPVGVEGSLEIVIEDSLHTVAIERVHMEEDTGKSIHLGSGRIDSATSTLLDFNRSGVPLVEVVTKPIISSAKMAVAYIEELRQLVIDLGISKGKLEKGNLRFDANISVAEEGSDELGVKVEIKNMNSLKSLEKAIDYEILRQTKMVQDKESIIQETRHWDENKQVTLSMRTKEGSADYRYFSDPDLPNMVINDEFIEISQNQIKETPEKKRKTLLDTGLSLSDSNYLDKGQRWLYELYLSTVKETGDCKSTFNFLTGELQGQMRKAEISELPQWLNSEKLASLINLFEDNEVSFTSAKDILAKLLIEDIDPKSFASDNNLIQSSDNDEIQGLVTLVINENQDIVERLENPEDKLVGFLVGQVMKSSESKVNPGSVKEVLLKELFG
uniref:Aspartyl/glutamyl-tRNA(Asn/Gln) amidotransferase subunit B n=1 Tax=Candidatus Actinomarina minuta TaxID=1389454 RepID=S5DP25_9ACTN|nr:Asp-tRNAAsn/Glu-tRNAGln amidotransferase B subunit [Candidatus Actinomarina minuta]